MPWMKTHQNLKAETAHGDLNKQLWKIFNIKTKGISENSLPFRY
jgi:hypothetical protein